MSQSPEGAVRRSRYEDGWEAINRMIREDGSWSGRERDVFLIACDDGTFVDASRASGLDFIEDARAFSVLDYDGDGDPDLAVRNRNGPRLRLLQNTFRTGNRAVWIHLTGRRCNRDAIGARVELETPRGTRVKEVEAGSGFLSQHSRWLWFGLGGQDRAPRARVRWPGGDVQELGALEGGRRYRVVQGEEPTSEPIAPEAAERVVFWGTPGSARDSALADDPPQASPLAQAWLIDPLLAPDSRLSDLDGRPRALSDFRGRPLALLFLSPTCAPCQGEVAEITAGWRKVEQSGVAVLGMAVGGALDSTAVRAAFPRAPFPIVLADDAAAATWNAVHRGLFNRYRDLAVPTTLLLDAEGRIEKVYRGRASLDDLLADARRLPIPESARLEIALPFRGTRLQAAFKRDLFLLGASLVERGAAEPAAEALRRSLVGGAEDAETLYNLGLARSDAGDLAGAAEAYRGVLELRPDLVDAINNLGILEARAGRIDEARRRFQEVLSLQPGHGEAALNLARTYLDEGRPADAERIYMEALRVDPESPLLWTSLGYAHFRLGRLNEGIAAYQKALAFAPADGDAAAGLANLLIQRGRTDDLAEARRVGEAGARRNPRHAGVLNALGLIRTIYEDFAGAETAYERAIAADPSGATPYLNLARIRLKRGDRPGVEDALRRLLAVQPDHAEAQAMLKKLDGG